MKFIKNNMEKISINDVYKLIKENNYKLISNINGEVLFKKGNNIIKYELKDFLKREVNVIKPNYDNSILSIVSSIKKYYGKKTQIKTHNVIDKYLKEKEYKHISILLLDGMGSMIMDDNLPSDSFLLKNKVCNLSSLFPPTTACVIPATQSGLKPIESGWVGWENYFEEINKHVVMFKNTDYFTEEALDFKVRDVLPYQNFYENFDVFSFELGPSFHPSKCQSFDEMCNKFLEETHKRKGTFSYLYWDEPDYSLHEFGSGSFEVKNILNGIDSNLENLYKNMEKDTLMIITADHGHIDINNIYFSNFIDLNNMLERIPSNEGRCAFFKVKPFKKKKFEKLFNLYFGDYFTLIKKADFLNEGYLGESDSYNMRLDSFIGDYVGIAKKNYSFVFNPNLSSDKDSDFVMKSHHAGITTNEMITPLIILAK